eukprot:1428108-Rhodomonas_salina.1
MGREKLRNIRVNLKILRFISDINAVKMGKKKATRKAAQAQEVVGRNERGEFVSMPLPIKGAVPKHADWWVPMQPKEVWFRPIPTFCMSWPGARVDEEPARLTLNRSSLSDSSLLTGSKDDEDLVAAEHRLAVLRDSEQEWLHKSDTPHNQDIAQDRSQIIDGPFSDQFVVEPMPGFPDLRYQRLSDEEARLTQGETTTVWVRPAKFTLRSETGITWYVFGYDSNDLRVGIPGEEGKPIDKKLGREI